MSIAELKQSSTSSHTYLLVPILLLFVLLIVAVLRAPPLISNAGLGSAIIVAAPLILATYALTIIAMAGRVGVDLSIGPLLGFINVSMIQLFAAEVITTPIGFFAYAIMVGVLYQILMGLIIVYVRVQPIIVALSGFLALVGLNLVILPRPGGVAPEWMMPWGLGTSIFSPVLAIVVLATIAWFFLTRTAFYGHLRLMGADERTAYASGVRINIVRLGAHAIAGVYAALAALTFTALISSGDPTQGTTYTLMAVTALVLGGTSLAGGRGSVIGSLLGALNIYLITYVLSTFNFGMVQSFVTDAAYGVVLVVSLLLTLALPRLPAGIRRISPFAFFIVIGTIAFGVILHSKVEVIAPPQVAETSGLTVLGGDTSSSSGSGLTVLGGESESSSGSGLTVLGGESESPGLTVLGGEISAPGEAAPKGTPLVFAAIIIAVMVYLVYLLYRHASISLVAFIGVLILLVLGLSLYDRLGPADRSTMAKVAGAELAMTGRDPPRVFLFEFVEPETKASNESIIGVEPAAFASPVISWTLVIVGTILTSSLLIVITLPKVRTRIGNVPLLFFLALGTATAGVIVFANNGVSVLPEGFYIEALGAVLVGAVLFVASLPGVQSRVKNLSFVLFAILSMTALGAMFFAGGPNDKAAPPDLPAQTASESAQAMATIPDRVLQIEPSEAFYVETFWVILAGLALFILTLPRVRTKILTYAALAKGVKAFSYTGGFLVVFSVIAMSAMFYVAGIPLWKLGVAIVAATIAARYGWHFLQRYRSGAFLTSVRDDFGERDGGRQLLGAKR